MDNDMLPSLYFLSTPGTVVLRATVLPDSSSSVAASGPTGQPKPVCQAHH